ncbi:hypothetical protein CcaCcLH18_03641 [Colletotrichum camelliae]|nr:hypothetical protein CcaCcLH18_03641 [Colletotrichum camelliae]
MPEYQYKSLGSHSIRRLKLLPGEFEDPLRGRLQHRIFDPSFYIPNYEALSYAWGEQDDPETLSIVSDSTEDESCLRIGKNLASALRDLRRTSESRSVWCDAVCINQRDLPERAAQVQRMADIFRHAGRVVVWLAPDNELVARAMQIFDEIGSLVGYDDLANEFYGHHEGDISYVTSAYLVPLSHHDWQCLIHLADLPWFTRLWVRQEIILANDSAVLTSGKRELLWSRFSSAVHYLCMKLDWDETVVKASQTRLGSSIFEKAMDVLECRRAVGDSRNVVALMGSSKCADPRDRVYGILGLQTSLHMAIDYEKTAKEVYTDWALECYRHYSSLEFFDLCEMACKPSWVPNLDKPMSIDMGFVRANSAAQTKAVLDLLPDQLCIEITALQCGSVTQYTSAMPQKPDKEDIQNTLQSWISELFPHEVHTHDSPEKNNLMEAISGGRQSERIADGIFSMGDVKSALLQRGGESQSSNPKRSPMPPNFRASLNRYIHGTAVFAIDDGHFGLGSSAARAGDEIFVVLGCRMPIVMRPMEDSKYSIIGPCYIPHLSHGEAVLGPLPDGWKMMFGSKNREYFVAPDGSQTLEDPRMEEDLPFGWEQDESADQGYLVWKRFEDNVWNIFDPRQTPEQLKARGVKLKVITLV